MALRTSQGEQSRKSADSRPPAMPPRRAPRRKVTRRAPNEPARATRSHSEGARESPSSEKGAVKSTGSGFHDGPLTVSRSRCMISRPQMIQAHGS